MPMLILIVDKKTYEQTAWFITLGCERQPVSFPALLIANQGVIEKFEESRPEIKKNCDSHLILGSCKFFLDFSVADLLRYNELLIRIKTENTN